MAGERERMELLLASVRRDREAEEAKATQAADKLMREASGITKLSELDADRIRALADDFAGAVERLKLHEEHAARLREALA